MGTSAPSEWVAASATGGIAPTPAVGALLAVLARRSRSAAR
ncbi:hypothetical protein ACIRP7_34570 [Streptomyces sp. NPDC102270]